MNILEKNLVHVYKDGGAGVIASSQRVDGFKTVETNAYEEKNGKYVYVDDSKKEKKEESYFDDVMVETNSDMEIDIFGIEVEKKENKLEKNNNEKDEYDIFE